MGKFRRSDRRVGDYLRELGSRVYYAPSRRRRYGEDMRVRRERAAIQANDIRNHPWYRGPKLSEEERGERAREQADALRNWAMWEDHYGGEKYKIRGEVDSSYTPPERLSNFRAEYQRRESLQLFVDLFAGCFWATLAGTIVAFAYVVYKGIDADMGVAFYLALFVAAVWGLFVFVDYLYRRDQLARSGPFVSETQVQQYREKARARSVYTFNRFVREELFRACTFGAAVGGVYVIGHWPVGYWFPVYMFTAGGFFGYLLFVLCVFIWKSIFPSSAK